MTQFSTSTTLSVSVSSSSLASARDTIESELGGVSVDVSPSSSGSPMTDGGVAGGVTAGLTRTLGEQSELAEESLSLSEERNTLLREIRDFAERGAMNGGGGGGGGLASSLLPLGILSSLGGGGLLGTLSVSAASVLTVTGTLGLAAAGVLSVSGYLGLNAANVLAVTGTLGITATAALAFSGTLALTATGVLAVTGALGLTAGSVLFVMDQLGLDVHNVLAVSGSLGLSAAAVLAVTGALSLPAAGVLAVAGTLTIAASQVLDLKLGMSPASEEFTGKNSKLDPKQGTATPTRRPLWMTQEGVDKMNTDQSSASKTRSQLPKGWSNWSAARKQEWAKNHPEVFNSANTGSGQGSSGGSGGSGGAGGSAGSGGGGAGPRNNAKSSRQRKTSVEYSPTFDVDTRTLEKKLEKSLREFETRIADLEKQLDRVTR